MREIKFRAWDKKLKKMFPWEVIKLHDDPYFCDDEDYEIMQYTGLKDKNSREIYEGDIICIYDGGEYGYYEPSSVIVQVQWDNEYCGFILARQNKDREYFEESIGADSFEVIGNIYENPELLGGEQHEKA